MTVSFFEWVQNLQNFRWEEDEVNKRLDRCTLILVSASALLSPEFMTPCLLRCPDWRSS